MIVNLRSVELEPFDEGPSGRRFALRPLGETAGADRTGMTVYEVSDLDLSYTPPLGSPWEAVQMGTQAWDREVRHLST